MDTALKNGDFNLENCGSPYLIDDIEEILQRATIALTVKKGSDIYNREFGSQLYMVDFNDSRWESTVELLVREALKKFVPQADVLSVTGDVIDDRHKVTVVICACGKAGEIEVII